MAEEQFKVPPAFGESGDNQESTPKVDNFSPPGSFKVPSEMPKKEPEEVEDVFAKPSQAKPETEPKKEPESVPAKQKLDLPQEKKGCACVWPIIIVLILIILLVGAVFINEWGIFNLGLEKYYGAIHLEKLWGGLPIESKLALADSFNKIKNKSFKLEGSTKADFFLASLEDSPSGVWSEGLNLQGEVKIKAEVQNKDKIEVNFITNLNSDSTAVNNLLAGDSAIDLTVIYNSSDIYLKSETLKKILGLDKDWLNIKSTSSSSDEIKTVSKLSDLSTGGKRVGWEKVNGVACYVYELKINSSAFQNYLDNNFPAISWLSTGASYRSIKFYLGKRDHLIYKLEIATDNNFENSSLGNKLIINFKDINSPIQIEPPASDETVEKNWSEIKDIFISGGVVTPLPTPTDTAEGRDKQRKSDLKEIQDVLLAYKAENGNYPSTSGLIEKTKDATSNLKTALVPKYLESLPLDPLADKYYYGYKSADGLSYELTSILEVKTDPEGEEVSGYWIYKLTGN